MIPRKPTQRQIDEDVREILDAYPETDIVAARAIWRLGYDAAPKPALHEAALAKCREALDGLFVHCLSNGVFNAWSQPMDCTKLNEAMDAVRSLAAPKPEAAPCNCEACMPQGAPMRMILCAICGNKRCPHATDHRNACTNSNEPGQPGSSWEDYPKPAPAAPALDSLACARVSADCSDMIDCDTNGCAKARYAAPAPETDEQWAERFGRILAATPPAPAAPAPLGDSYCPSCKLMHADSRGNCRCQAAPAPAFTPCRDIERQDMCAHCGEHSSLHAERGGLCAPAAPAPDACNWHQQDLDGDSWDTGCGHTFLIIDGTPTDNGFRFCCFCAKPLAQHPYVEDDE